MIPTMEPLTQLLARIDSKLNLILPAVSEYQTQIPTIVARVRRAQVHVREKNIHDLFFDLEWITKNLLGRKALKKTFTHFEHQILNLHLLKEQLKRHLLAGNSDDVLGQAVAHWRKKLLKSFESVEHDLMIIKEKMEAEMLLSHELKMTLNFFLTSEQALKEKLWSPAVTEEDIIGLFSFMGEKVQSINRLLMTPRRVDIIEVLRKVLLQDWGKLIDVMVALFKEAYKKTTPSIEVRAVRGREGIPRLDIQHSAASS